MDPRKQPAPLISSLDEPEHPAVPRDSATVLVMRDGPEGPEVFMLERHLRSDVLGGAYVFPGGTVDPADTAPGLADHVDGISDDLARAMGDGTPGLVVCAIRETFEEAGILLARDAAGALVRLDDERWSELRRALNAREITALGLARAAGIRFAADLLRYWGRLITPVQAPKRYDARFFMALAPEGQEPLHDDGETTASAWVRPLDAVARGRAGEMSIIFPTRVTLESVGEFGSAAEAFAAAIGRPAADVTPRIVMHEGQPRIQLPDGSFHTP